MHANGKWHDLSNRHKEALDMIQHKIGRIIAGNANFPTTGMTSPDTRS